MKENFIAGAVAAGFTEQQAAFLWTAIPFHPLTEEWKRLHRFAEGARRGLNDPDH